MPIIVLPILNFSINLGIEFYYIFYLNGFCFSWNRFPLLNWKTCELYKQSLQDEALYLIDWSRIYGELSDTKLLYPEYYMINIQKVYRFTEIWYILFENHLFHSHLSHTNWNRNYISEFVTEWCLSTFRMFDDGWTDELRLQRFNNNWMDVVSVLNEFLLLIPYSYQPSPIFNEYIYKFLSFGERLIDRNRHLAIYWRWLDSIEYLKETSNVLLEAANLTYQISPRASYTWVENLRPTNYPTSYTTPVVVNNVWTFVDTVVTTTPTYTDLVQCARHPRFYTTMSYTWTSFNDIISSKDLHRASSITNPRAHDLLTYWLGEYEIVNDSYTWVQICAVGGIISGVGLIVSAFIN